MKCKKLLCLLLSLLMILSITPLTAFAYEKDLSVTGDTQYISSYAQLKAEALQARSDVTYILTEEIFQDDNLNDMEIVIGSGTFTLDLNGYGIHRETSGTDLTLFRIKSGAQLVINDTSDNQGGSCTFSSGYGNYNKSVFRNSGTLTIYNGFYEITSPYDQGNCCAVFADRGETCIYGGTFDSSDSSGGSSIVITHGAPLYDVPHVTVYGGDFYAKYINVEAYSYNDFINDGCLYPTVYVLGGNFYVTKESDYSGFAYCNNAWGRVIVAGGVVPAVCANIRDRRFLTGTSKEIFSHTVDDYEAFYYEVTPPAMIMTDQFEDFTRLERLCDKDVVKSYDSTVYELFKSEFDEIMSYRDTAFMLKDFLESLEINLTNRTIDHKYINWYICDEKDYCGDNTDWTHLGDIKNVSTWTFNETPDKTTNYLIRCVVTNSDLTTYEDIVKVNYNVIEALTVESVAITDLDTPMAGANPDFDVTTEDSFYINGIFYTDVTDPKNKVTLKETDTFIAGHTYQLEVWIRAENGYEFNTDSDGWVDISATINSQDAEVIPPGSRISAELTLTYTVEDNTDKVLLGDTNNDGKVSVIDATTVQRYLAQIPVDDFKEKAADTDENGKVTITDATTIQRYLVGLMPNSRINTYI